MRTLLMTLLVGTLINIGWTKGLHYLLTSIYDTKTYYEIYLKYEGLTTPAVTIVYILVWVFFVWANFRKVALDKRD